MREFKEPLTKEISIDDIRPALSAEVYSTTSRTTNWGNWEKGLPESNNTNTKGGSHYGYVGCCLRAYLNS